MEQRERELPEEPGERSALTPSERILIHCSSIAADTQTEELIQVIRRLDAQLVQVAQAIHNIEKLSIRDIEKLSKQ